MDGPRRCGYGAHNGYDIRTRCIRGRLERRQGVSPGWIRQPFSDKSRRLGAVRGARLGSISIKSITLKGAGKSFGVIWAEEGRLGKRIASEGKRREAKGNSHFPSRQSFAGLAPA